MSSIESKQDILWGGAQELAAEVYDPDLYPDEFEDLAEQIWLEMCEEEGLDPYYY